MIVGITPGCGRCRVCYRDCVLGLAAFVLAFGVASSDAAPVSLPGAGMPGRSPPAEPATPRTYPPLSTRGERWRGAWSVLPVGYVAWMDDPHSGVGLDVFFGVGYPVRSAPGVRVEHAVGYSGLVVFEPTFFQYFHRHRIAASGLIGDRTALYYQAGAGIVASYGAYGSNAGGRLGLAIGSDFNYIMAFGAELNTYFVRGEAYVSPVLTLALVGGGRL